MSQANVAAFRRMVDAVMRRDLDDALSEMHPEVRWHSAIMVPLGGESTVSCGRDGVAAMFREFYEAFTEIAVEFSEVQDLGERVVAIGRIRTRGAGSRAETESSWSYVVDYHGGQAIVVQTFLDPAEARTAADRAAPVESG